MRVTSVLATGKVLPSASRSPSLGSYIGTLERGEVSRSELSERLVELTGARLLPSRSTVQVELAGASIPSWRVRRR